VFVGGKPFQPGLMVAEKARSLPNQRGALASLKNTVLGLKRFARGKCCSLFDLLVTYEEKLNNIGSRCLSYLTILLTLTLRIDKLECLYLTSFFIAIS
jgi:hypothetical protein